MITFRLADSLPASVAVELSHSPKDAKARQKLEACMDAGHGSCHLQNPQIATLVENALVRFDGERYRLLAWVVMPNHVHVLIETFAGHVLCDVVHSWKSYTSKKIAMLLGTTGRFWQPEYYDRMIRSEEHLTKAVEYIHWNPVKAGLVREPEDWRFSSATRR
ncbi:MAG: transposase [Actinobacteria bacterium]|nr:transposase [Actinomycetota bacterium]